MKVTTKPNYRKNKPLPELVLGTAGLGGVWGKVDHVESIETILCAIEYGIKRIDTAPAYYKAERIIEEVLLRWSGQKPFISTKVGRMESDSAFKSINNYEVSVMEESILRSMHRLHCDKLDLLFLHEPENVPRVQIPGVINFLVSLKDSGKIDKLGFGGVPPKIYWQYIELGYFDVVMGYNNLDASCIDGMKEDIPFFRKNGMLIYQGSALHMGLLGNRFNQYQQEQPSWLSPQSLLNASKANNIAQGLGINLSTLAHRFLLSIAEVDYLVIGPRNMEQLKKTLDDCGQGSLEEEVFIKMINLIQ